MAFKFGPCTPCCNAACSGNVFLTSCTASGAFILPAYLSESPSGMIFTLYGPDGSSVLGTCAPLVSSGLCSFVIQNFNQIANWNGTFTSQCNNIVVLNTDGIVFEQDDPFLGNECNISLQNLAVVSGEIDCGVQPYARKFWVAQAQNHCCCAPCWMPLGATAETVTLSFGGMAAWIQEIAGHYWCCCGDILDNLDVVPCFSVGQSGGTIVNECVPQAGGYGPMNFTGYSFPITFTMKPLSGVNCGAQSDWVPFYNLSYPTVSSVFSNQCEPLTSDGLTRSYNVQVRLTRTCFTNQAGMSTFTRYSTSFMENGNVVQNLSYWPDSPWPTFPPFVSTDFTIGDSGVSSCSPLLMSHSVSGSFTYCASVSYNFPNAPIRTMKTVNFTDSIVVNG